MKNLLLGVALIIGLTSFHHPVDDGKGDDVIGVWLTGKKTAHVEIFKTGKYYYGKIVWI
ncbi:MAG: DUF2147 domain-containing protein [Bacteroidota bacterium]|nr:DUF2147 domain-containing protein [Bacteroidota bacterium]MDX5431832.1 DUF2147 domain-containing protein [Bacteroidota bacterium]MDX5470545.1 DUF2147 domain-containing protein [Bacteroidota bacterium]